MKIQKDKKLHFAVNFICSIVGGIYGILLGLGLSFGKEYGDSKAVGNRWDWYDIIADCLGLIIGGCIHYFIYLLLF